MTLMESRLIPSADKFDAVLPLTARDFGRFRILDVSLQRFCEDLGVCWIVIPDEELYEFPRMIKEGWYRVVPESKIVPEFRYFPQCSGWYKQQLVKIAIAHHISTDFYLTLDADLVCTRTLHCSDLVRAGRGRCFVDQTDVHPDWYCWSERVLKLRRSGACHNVTPAVLSREAVLKMQCYLSGLALTEKSHFRLRRQDMLRLRSAKGTCSGADGQLPGHTRLWALFLLANIPWTEYALYYTFLEANDLFNEYHFSCHNALYSLNSLWHKGQLRSWDPRKSFLEEDSSFFMVVQSNTGIDPQLVWEQIYDLVGK